MNTHDGSGNHDNEGIDGMSETTNARWRAIAVEELRATPGEYVEAAGVTAAMAVVGALAAVGALHGWAGMPAPVWWVLVGLIGSQLLDAANYMFDLWRGGDVVLRCTVCRRVWDRAEDVAEHWGTCRPTTDEIGTGVQR